MSEYGSVDFSQPRRPTGPLTPTDIDDVQKFIIKPLQDAGFRLNTWGSENSEKFMRLIRNDVFDFEYTKGNDTSVFQTVLRGLDYDEETAKKFDGIAEQGVQNYVNTLRKRDQQALKLKKRQLNKTLLLSTETPFKQLPPGIVSKVTNYAVGGKTRHRRKHTKGRTRKTRRFSRN